MIYLAFFKYLMRKSQGPKGLVFISLKIYYFSHVHLCLSGYKNKIKKINNLIIKTLKN